MSNFHRVTQYGSKIHHATMTGVTVPPLWAEPSEAMQKKEKHVYTCKSKIGKKFGKVRKKFLEKLKKVEKIFTKNLQVVV